jgi:hypothetical protein
LKLALTLNYKKLNSKNMHYFYKRFESVYPGEIKIWQSDNGSENLGDFDKQPKKDEILHLFSYPRCPKIYSYNDKVLFNRQLADYLIFYNTK